MQVPVKIHSFPVRLNGKEAVAIATILALETIIMTALQKKYSIELPLTNYIISHLVEELHSEAVSHCFIPTS